MLRNDSDEAFLQLEHVIDLAFNIARRALRAAGNLMDHDIGIRQRKALALGPCAKKDRRHAGRHSEAISGHVAREKLHRVIDRESCSNRAAGRIDRKSTRLNSSHRTISYAVFCLKKKNK